MLPRFTLPLLILPLLTSLAAAQPPDVPSTIKKPPANVFVAMPAPPDPPLISPAELQKLTGGPTLVTLSGTNLPVADVSKALLATAGITSSNIYGPQQGTLSFDWKQTPFWVAAAEVEKQTGNTWTSNFGDVLNLARFNGGNGGGLDGKVAARTPFLSLIATSITRTETNTSSFRQNPVPAAAKVATKSNNIQMMLSIYLDPKLKLQSASLREVAIQKAGEAAPLADENREFGYSYSRTRGPIVQQTLRVPNSVGAGTTLSRISGVLHTVVASGTETFNVPDLVATPKATKVINGTSFVLQSVNTGQNALSLHLAANAGAEPEQVRGREIDVFSMLSVRDAGGQELRRGGASYNGGPNANGDFFFNLTNIKGEAAVGPYSLEWTVVTEMRSLDVPFELRDVVVP